VNNLSLADRLISISRALRAGNVPYAFGGAIAFNYYAEPRSTHDLDINIFLPESSAQMILDILEPIGVSIDRKSDTERILRDGQIRLDWYGIFVDLFFATIPFLDHAGMRTQMVPFADDEIPILAAEDLVVCKTLFNRDKDWIDLRVLALFLGDHLDESDVDHWLIEIAGADDSRIARFHELLDDARATLANERERAERHLPQ
jgi:hypothetical protein